jgi:hypothetical protein
MIVIGRPHAPGANASTAAAAAAAAAPAAASGGPAAEVSNATLHDEIKLLRADNGRLSDDVQTMRGI